MIIMGASPLIPVVPVIEIFPLRIIQSLSGLESVGR